MNNNDRTLLKLAVFNAEYHLTVLNAIVKGVIDDNEHITDVGVCTELLNLEEGVSLALERVAVLHKLVYS